jgi:putative sporulation protein YtaF
LLLSIIVLAVTLSIDALFAGFSYGLSGTRIPFSSKLIICAFSVFYAALALLAGRALAGVLPPLAGKIIGAGVLAALGIFMIVKSLLQNGDKPRQTEEQPDEPRTLFTVMIKSLGITVQILKNNPAAGDLDNSGVIDKKEALLLGFALSVDSLGAGIGSAMSGLCAWYIPLAVGFCQLAFLSVGLSSGGLLSGRPGGAFTRGGMVTKILPGILLVGLSVLRFL